MLRKEDLDAMRRHSSIGLKCGTDKIIFVKLGKVYWRRYREQNGMVVHMQRVKADAVAAEVSQLKGWKMVIVQ